MRNAAALLPLALIASSCAGGDSTPTPIATRLAFTTQPGTTTAGQAVTPAVGVAVQDADGNTVTTADDRVTLTLNSNAASATLSGTTTANASGGVATFADLAIDKPGTFTLTAAAPNLTSATSAAFDITPIPGVAAVIAPVSGDEETAPVGQAVPTSPSVKVTDGLGAPVANVPVTFVIESGGGTVTGESQTTDAGGVATAGQWTLGTTAGANTLLAMSGDLQGSPVTFTATALAGPPVAIVSVSVEDQVVSVGGSVAERPAVLVTDAFDNPASGVSVTFEVTEGGGSATGTSQVTAADGIAVVGSWTAGNAPGQNTMTATVTGLTGSPVTFHATGTTFTPAVTVEVHSDFFLSLRNGSGANPTELGSVAVDTIAAGGTVTWQWVGNGHNVTPYQNTAFTASPTQNAGFTYGPVTFTTPGTYTYRCTIHSGVVDILGLIGMRGRIVVR